MFFHVCSFPRLNKVSLIDVGATATYVPPSRIVPIIEFSYIHLKFFPKILGYFFEFFLKAFFRPETNKEQ